jgi:hypothetical protein
MPLPKGIVRVYKQDQAGSVQFVGEDRIDHTPDNETVRLKLGNAFDITADRKQTDFKKLAGFGAYNYVAVRVVEPMPGDWDILSENLTHKKISSSESEWLVTVPAKGSAELLYRVKVRF